MTKKVDETDIYEQPDSIRGIELHIDRESESPQFDEIPADQELDFNDKPRGSQLDLFDPENLK